MTKINKEGWEIKKLGEVTDFSRGLTYSGKDEVPISSNVVLRSNNITLESQSLNLNELKYINDSIVIPADKKLAKDTIFMCMSNGSMKHIGKVAYIDKDYDYAFGGFMGLMRPKAEVIFPKYLYLYFCSQKFKYVLEKIANGANINNIKFSDINQEKITLPPLPIQQRIVDELDEINAIISAKKQQISKLDELAQSIFYNMFGDPVANEKGWEVKTMGEIGSIERGAGISKKDFVNEGLPCIHYGQLHTVLGPTTHTHLTCIPKDLLPKYKYAHPNDVVMAITSEDVEGSCKSTAWLGDYDVVVGSDAAVFHHNQNGVYVSYYTQTKAFYNEKAKYAKGFKVTHISAKEIAIIPIPTPPLPLQEAFAARVSAIEEEKTAIAASIEKMQTLLDARMQEYFG